MKSIVIILFCFIGELVIPQISFYPIYNLSDTPNSESGNHSVYFEPGGNYYIVWVDDDKILFKKWVCGHSWFHRILSIGDHGTNRRAVRCVCGVDVQEHDGFCSLH